MGIAYNMPKLAMAMNEGSINEWLIKQGDKVEKGQPLVTVETEKVSYDCESPESGYFCIVGEEGETVPCEQLIGYFCDSADEAAALLEEANGNAVTAAPETDLASTTSPAESNINSADTTVTTPSPAATPLPRQPGERIKASPLAKKMANEQKLTLATIKGTGPGGRIVKRDILRATISGEGQAQVAATSSVNGELIEKARIPMTGMRKVIAERMMQSLQTTAQLSSAWESDITDLLAARKKLVARADQLGTRISVNAFIIKAIAYGIKQVPIANACQQGDDIVIYDNINMGIAVAMPGNTEYGSGLMVAVLRNVERMGLVDIDREMKALIARVREGNGSAEDLSGSTITLSTTAGIAPPGMTTTPVLNLPNAALVGPSTAVDKPVVKDGQIVVRTMMPVSLTFDHRLLDGEPAARFMKAIHEALENPELMLA